MGDLDLGLFSTIMTLCRPQDVTLQELRIETWSLPTKSPNAAGSSISRKPSASVIPSHKTHLRTNNILGCRVPLSACHARQGCCYFTIAPVHVPSERPVNSTEANPSQSADLLIPQHSAKVVCRTKSRVGHFDEKRPTRSLVERVTGGSTQERVGDSTARWLVSHASVGGYGDYALVEDCRVGWNRREKPVRCLPTREGRTAVERVSG